MAQSCEAPGGQQRASLASVPPGTRHLRLNGVTLQPPAPATGVAGTGFGAAGVVAAAQATELGYVLPQCDEHPRVPGT